MDQGLGGMGLMMPLLRADRNQRAHLSVRPLLNATVILYPEGTVLMGQLHA
jgi:hypothetical protein